MMKFHLLEIVIVIVIVITKKHFRSPEIYYNQVRLYMMHECKDIHVHNEKDTSK
jgi:hypothetical protein